MNAKYLFLDLETTGLDPYNGKILECVAVATTAELEDVSTFCMQLRADASVRNRANEFVQAMHDRNGLWNACLYACSTVADLDDMLRRTIAAFDWDDKKPILAGNTVHFDRGWLAVHCPAVVAQLHHRHLDVSSLKLAADDPFPSSADQIHRAADDVAGSIAKARELFARMRR